MVYSFKTFIFIIVMTISVMISGAFICLIRKRSNVKYKNLGDFVFKGISGLVPNPYLMKYEQVKSEFYVSNVHTVCFHEFFHELYFFHLFYYLNNSGFPIWYNRLKKKEQPIYISIIKLSQRKTCVFVRLEIININ